MDRFLDSVELPAPLMHPRDLDALLAAAAEGQAGVTAQRPLSLPMAPRAEGAAESPWSLPLSAEGAPMVPLALKAAAAERVCPADLAVLRNHAHGQGQEQEREQDWETTTAARMACLPQLMRRRSVLLPAPTAKRRVRAPNQAVQVRLYGALQLPI